MPFQITIEETFPTTRSQNESGGVLETIPLIPSIERLRMTVDGPVDVMPIIALLQKKPRAVRKDAGKPRKEAA